MKKIVLAEFTTEKLDLIMYHIRKAIHEVNKDFWNEEKLRISIPEYLMNLIVNYKDIMDPRFEFNEGDFRLFGVKCIPAFDNFVVVFSLDNPLYKNTNYQVIDLK